MYLYQHDEADPAGPPSGGRVREHARDQESSGFCRQTVIAALEGTDPGPRLVARRTVDDLQTTLHRIADQKRSVDETITLLTREVTSARARRRMRYAYLAVLLAVVTVCTFFTHGRVLHTIWIFNLFGGAWAADQMAGTRRDAAMKLRDAGDPRAVGVLAIAARDGDPRVQSASEDALRKLLPRLRASDSAYIAKEQMDALIQIGYQDRPGLRRAIMIGLKQVGDERAIPLIHHVMLDPREYVRREAVSCLEYVQQRVRLSRESATLLRASSACAIEAGGTQLLRAASGAPVSATPPDEMLRAVSAPD